MTPPSPDVHPIRRVVILFALGAAMVGAALGCASGPGATAVPPAGAPLAMASLEPGVHRGESAADGRTMTWRLFVPAEIAARRPVPLVLALHRFSETGPIMAAMTGFDAIGEREGFAVVYPSGPWRRFRFGGQRPSDVDLLRAVLDDVARLIPVDLDRVYVTGASNGGFMTYTLAAADPGRFAAIAPVMAAETLDPGVDVPDGVPPPLPLMVVHGMEDRIVPADRSRLGGFRVRTLAETVEAWRVRNRSEGEPATSLMDDRDPDDGTRTRTTTHSPGPGGAPIIVHRVDGGGHTWPGGGERSPRFIVGRVARDWNASEVIWAFFAEHRRRSEEPELAAARPRSTPTSSTTFGARPPQP